MSKDNTKKPDILSALAVGPLAILPAMLLAISVLRIIYPEAQAEILHQYHGGLVASFFGLILSYAFTLLYGIPVYWLLNHFNRYNGAMIIVASLLPALFLSMLDHEQWPYYLAMAYFSVFVATACWLLTLRKK